jgi:UDP-N-acetylmuramate--alanine ligase
LTFLPEFAESFGNADIVIITDIYSAGEQNLEQITGQQVRDAIAVHHKNVYYAPTLDSVLELLSKILCSGDLALFLGAGNLNQIIPQVMEFYQKAEKDQSRKSRELTQKA